MFFQYAVQVRNSTNPGLMAITAPDFDYTQEYPATTPSTISLLTEFLDSLLKQRMSSPIMPSSREGILVSPSPPLVCKTLLNAIKVQNEWSTAQMAAQLGLTEPETRNLLHPDISVPLERYFIHLGRFGYRFSLGVTI